ncbi:MAG: twin-arginine translocase subunit TatC [Candidatus Marinimicrobia bacterium]|nr:twin-arginine translocase subunit TatC [Candidatus Neomarinimicrobiota bacterium]
MSDKASKKQQNTDDGLKELGFLDHLEELRWRIIKSLAAIMVIAIAAFAVSDIFIDLLLIPANNLQDKMMIQVLKVQGMFMLKIKVAGVMGLVGAIPVIAYQVWAFVAPGLYEKEKKWGKWLVLGVTIFFLCGAAFAYFVLVPFALKFLINIGTMEVKKHISISYYTQFVLRMLVAAGIVFQMPVLSFLMTKMGLINPRILRKFWRYAVIVSLVIAAFITPPDPISMMMMGIPLLFLYEFSILVSRLAGGSASADRSNNNLDMTDES